jgi:GNAT superfamily N-acetyltransferase
MSEVSDSIAPDRLQAYLRYSASRQYELIELPPFELFFHPTDTLRYFNYAIPIVSVQENVIAFLDKVKKVFEARDRITRFEFIEEFSPELGKILERVGFHLETRQELMICTMDALSMIPALPELRIEEVPKSTSAIQEFMEVQNKGFAPGFKRELGEAEVSNFLAQTKESRLYVGRLAKKAVCVGVCSPDHDGLTEIMGVTTLVEYRRQGIGTATCAYISAQAFSRGLEAVILSAQDRNAGRVYERVGFSFWGSILAYVFE